MNEITPNKKNEVVIEEKTLPEIVFNSTKVIKTDENEALKQVVISVAKVFLDKGTAINGSDLSLLSNDLLAYIKKDAPWITLTELSIIFSKGRRGEFGEYYGLNLNTFEVWIQKWTYDQRAEKMKKHIALLPPEKEYEPTPEETEKLINKHITESIIHFRSTGDILYSYLYKILFDQKKLPFHSKEYREHIRKKTIERLQSKKEKATVFDDMKSLSRKIQGKENISSLMKDTVLMDYFSSL